MEQWKPSREFENYEISDKGGVRNAKTGRVLKPITNNRGYQQVCLRDGGKQYTRKIARLVADTYVDGGRPELDVTYLDGDKKNLDSENLKWCTRKEAINRTHQPGEKPRHKMRRVRCVETGEEYDSIDECSDDMGVDRHIISRLVNRRSYESKCGYHFEPVD